MTKNGKETSKKSENGYRKKINGAYTYLLRKEMKMKQRNEKMLEKKAQPKIATTKVKRKKLDERDIAVRLT